MLPWIRSLEGDLDRDYDFEKLLERQVDFAFNDELQEKLESQLRLFSGRQEWSLDSAVRIQEASLSINAVASKINICWLRDQVDMIMAYRESSMRTEEFVECIIATLQSNSKNLENELLELIGFDFIDILSDLIKHKSKIVESWELEKIELAAASKSGKPGQSIQMGEKLAKRRGIVLSSFSTQMHLNENNIVNLALDDDKPGSAFSGSSNYPGVFKANLASTTTSSYLNKLAIPTGTNREDNMIFEEFSLPYTAHCNNPKANSIRIRQINDLDPISKKAFPSYKALNRMQSAVYQVAHKTNENMLVCAPTGAGKTDVAMLAVLRCILDNYDGQTIKKDKFKIVYVAPMKALAAEITEKFGRRLKPVGLTVREYTGDMQLCRAEVQSSQMIVTTPEKWDVITRKSQGDIDLVDLVKLLIIDEVHLLQDDRGPVLEAIVARALRAVELNQRPVRIVGLSATLPNYIDVASFLRVNLHVGMFYFDESFRPVPLSQSLIGIKGTSETQLRERLAKVCFDRTVGFLKDGHQVMIFVHSRNETVGTAKQLVSMAREEGLSLLFLPTSSEDLAYKKAAVEVSQKSRNRELQDLFKSGLAMHHAGMLRSDRSLVEKLFGDGHVRVLVCTATLAWGVNLPAHAVIIKGTQLWDSQKGGFVRLGVLDVLQIFGRAGRPQYETYGEAILITKQTDLYHYLQALLTQTPIESRFSSGNHLTDMMNAEIALGTVSSIDEAIKWLGYTYLRIRMSRNPTGYGLTPKDLLRDPHLDEHLRRLVSVSAQTLKSAGMVSYDVESGKLAVREIGRIASHFYLGHETVELFGKLMNSLSVTEESVLAMISQSCEFAQLKVRQEELDELDCIESTSAHLRIKGLDKTSSAGKAALLIQAWISRHPIDSFSLNSDLNYIGKNAGRIMRAAWEMAKGQGWSRAARACLALALAFERQSWMTAHPICQVLFSNKSKKKQTIPFELLSALQNSNFSHYSIRTMNLKELKSKLGFKNPTATWEKSFESIKIASSILPSISIASSSCYPISASGYEVKAVIAADFIWEDFHHGSSELFHVWLEAADGEQLLSKETITEMMLTKGCLSRDVSFFLGSLPPRMFLRVTSDRWLLPQSLFEISVKNIPAIKRHENTVVGNEIDTDTLNLLRILGKEAESLNPILKSSLQFLNEGGLICAPPGSDMDTFIESILLKYASKRVSIVSRQNQKLLLGKLQGLGVDISKFKVLFPEPDADLECDVLILSDLDIFDYNFEFALSQIKEGTKIFSLSGPIANIQDFAVLLGTKNILSFGPESRPSPLQAQIQGFSGRYHYSRLASMNKPVYQAAINHQKILIWCPSRKQAALTAHALVSLTSNDDAPRRFVNAEFIPELDGSQPFRNALMFGIGIYHPGIKERARLLNLFTDGKIKVLIACLESIFELHGTTADLVIVKGTDIINDDAFFEAPSWLITRALTSFSESSSDGAPPSVILMTRDNQRSFYRHALCEAPLIESCLNSLDLFSNFIRHHGLDSKPIPEVIHFLRTESIFPARIASNPRFYNCPGQDEVERDEHLWRVVDSTINFLKDVPNSCKLGYKSCLALKIDDKSELSPQTILRLISLALSIEVNDRSTFIALPKLHKLTVDADEIAAYCNNSKDFQEAFRWLYQVDDSQTLRITENFSDINIHNLIALLAIICGLDKSPFNLDISLPEFMQIAIDCVQCILDQLKIGSSFSIADSALRLLIALRQRIFPEKIPVNPSHISWKLSSTEVSFEIPKVFVSKAKQVNHSSYSDEMDGWIAVQSKGVLAAKLSMVKPRQIIPITSPDVDVSLYTNRCIFTRNLQ